MSPTSTPPIDFDNSYARMGERFFARVDPTPVAAPRLIRVNVSLARDLGIDPVWLASPDGIAVLAGNAQAPGSEPIAMAYAGHQFGGFVPKLGDGRAILIGEVVDRHGVRRDIHLKGAGRTPFSRSGDGRAALGPVLREYLVSEAFAAIGIPTTRALAAVQTGEYVYRETPLPGAILARVAQSHIRVGTFQYFAARGEVESVRQLADYVIMRHYPDCRQAQEPHAELLKCVIERQAQLIARWMLVGFIHGVMNTDNMSIAGETIDFGPCAFMDDYHPAKVFSSIDRGGRYAYANQPAIAQWNLVRFAETLLPLLAETEEAAIAKAQDRIDRFPKIFEDALLAGYRRKLGLAGAEDGDLALVQDFLTLMAQNRADFTLAFRALSEVASGDEQRLRSLFLATDAFEAWLARWWARVRRDDVHPHALTARLIAANPLYIPRNHLIERVITAAQSEEDFAPFERLLDVLAQPFEERPGLEDYARPPAPDEVVHQTFCGT